MEVAVNKYLAGSTVYVVCQQRGEMAYGSTIWDKTTDGLWVTGLSGPVSLIVVGQSYVADGQKVRVAMAR